MPTHEISDDPRAQRSYRALVEAVGRLVDKMPVQEITITRIVAEAGLSRPTFYQYFDDVASALQYAALYRLEVSVPLIRDDGPGPFGHLPLPERLRATGFAVLSHLQECRAFYLAVLTSAPSTLFFDELVELASERLLPEIFPIGNQAPARLLDDLKYVLGGGSVWMVLSWLRGAFEATPQQLADRIATVLLAVGNQPLGSETR